MHWRQLYALCSKRKNIEIFIKDTLKVFDDFKIKQQKCVKKCFLICKSMYILKVSIHWDKTQMLKKFPLNKINGTKNALFFLSWATTHHNFTFNLQFLYELKHKIFFSKSVCGIFLFRFRFVFIKVFIFVQQNVWTLWI